MVKVNSAIATSPIGGAVHGGLDKAIYIAEVPYTPGIDLRVDPASPAFAAVNQVLGLTLNPQVGSVVRKNADCIVSQGEQPGVNGISALCLGPDWWLLTGTANIAALLKPVQEAHHISAVDVSAQRTKLEIYGPKVKEVLGHVWEQDLRDSEFPIDACTQGLMAKSPVILWHCCENCYLIFVRSSFAQHLWDVLTDSTVEYL